MKLKKYRIVEDEFGYFEIHVWSVYWPFWTYCDFGYTLTQAKNIITHRKRKQKIILHEE